MTRMKLFYISKDGTCFRTVEFNGNGYCTKSDDNGWIGLQHLIKWNFDKNNLEESFKEMMYKFNEKTYNYPTDELREEYAKLVGSSASNKVDLFDWYLFELQKWIGVYGYFIRRKDYATAEVIKYISSLSPEKEKEGCCDPAPQMKVIALLDCNCWTDIGFYLVCQTKPIDDKIFKMEKNFAHVRDIICEWDV